MIKFFRRIRHQLLTENKISKYLFYALGEIVLVVIGILIALQINTWNREKADRIVETKVLKELQRNLKIDLDEITFDISLLDSVHIACNEIINELKVNAAPSAKFYNNISILKVAPHFDPNKSAYEFLQSKGLDIITNDKLRELISTQYELNYPYYNKYENERIQFEIHHQNPFLVEHFVWTNSPEYFFSDSFLISKEALTLIKNDGSLERLVMASALENDLINDRAQKLKQQIKNLIELITRELELKAE